MNDICLMKYLWWEACGDKRPMLECKDCPIKTDCPNGDRKTEPQTEHTPTDVETMSCQECKHWQYIAKEWQCETETCQGYEPKDEPQTEEWYTYQDEQEYRDRWDAEPQTDCAG